MSCPSLPLTARPAGGEHAELAVYALPVTESNGEQWLDWVQQWATGIDAATSSMMATFETDYGYAVGHQ